MTNPFLRLARMLHGLPPAAISRNEAIRLAKQEVARHGLEWREPILVQEELRCYGILTGMHVKGNNIGITVDLWTGDIISLYVIPF